MEKVRLVFCVELILAIAFVLVWSDFALYGESVLFEFHLEVFGTESCDSHRDSVFVFVDFLDVVGRIGGGGSICHFVEELEQSVESDGCSEEGSEVESCHGISP